MASLESKALNSKSLDEKISLGMTFGVVCLGISDRRGDEREVALLGGTNVITVFPLPCLGVIGVQRASGLTPPNA